MSTHRYSALLTDLYELTMLAGYFEKGMHRQTAVFDMFFRHNPFTGGYAIFAGLQPTLEYLSQLQFTAADLAYLQTLGIFKPAFLDYLKDFRFRGKVTAPAEGTVVFANEPLITIEGGIGRSPVGGNRLAQHHQLPDPGRHQSRTHRQRSQPRHRRGVRIAPRTRTGRWFKRSPGRLYRRSAQHQQHLGGSGIRYSDQRAPMPIAGLWRFLR